MRCILPLEVSRHSDFAVDQGLHHPADHLIKRARHVFTEFALEAFFHILPVVELTGKKKLSECKYLMGFLRRKLKRLSHW